MIKSKDLFAVLIVSEKEDNIRRLTDRLDRAVFLPPNTAKNAEDARRILLHSSYDLIIIDSRPPRIPGVELATDMSDKTGAAVILLCDGNQYDETRYRLESEGIAVVAKPYTLDALDTALNVSMAAHNRVLAIEEDNRKLRFKLEELRLVNRAKRALLENMAMNEPDAHRFIEKYAMDNRMTRHAVAKKILKEYE